MEGWLPLSIPDTPDDIENSRLLQHTSPGASGQIESMFSLLNFYFVLH
jgi:hypothetical protein